MPGCTPPKEVALPPLPLVRSKWKLPDIKILDLEDISSSGVEKGGYFQVGFNDRYGVSGEIREPRNFNFSSILVAAVSAVNPRMITAVVPV